MAERLNIEELSSPSYQIQPGQELIGDVLAPGSSTALGLRPGVGNPYGNTLNFINRGRDRFGVGGLETMFGGEGGTLSDPFGLLKLLNLSALRRGEGFAGSNPYAVGDPSDVTGYSERGVARAGDLQNWLDQLTGYHRQRFQMNNPFWLGQNAITDLGQLQGANVTPGVTTLADLDTWARQQLGVDFATWAAMSPALRGFAGDVGADPSLLIDPESPGMLDVRRIPGMTDADFNLRAGEYATGYQNLVNEIVNRGNQAPGELYNRALQANPQAGRTAYGAFLGGAGPQMAAYSSLPYQSPANYNFGLMQALLPYQMSAAQRGGI